MLVRLLYIVLLAFLVRLLWRGLVQRALASLPRAAEGMGGEERAPTIHRGLMVRDPVCGIHVPESRALVEERGGERFLFCSDKCRNEFRKQGP